MMMVSAQQRFNFAFKSYVLWERRPVTFVMLSVGSGTVSRIKWCRYLEITWSCYCWLFKDKSKSSVGNCFVHLLIFSKKRLSLMAVSLKSRRSGA